MTKVKVFISKTNVLAIGIDDRSLETIKSHKCYINYGFGNIPMHVNREKVIKSTSGNIAVMQVMKAKGSRKKVNLLSIEEERLDLRLLRLEIKMERKDYNPPSCKKSSTWNPPAILKNQVVAEPRTL